MNQQPQHQTLDLVAIARKAMTQNGFYVDFPDDVQNEVKSLSGSSNAPATSAGVRDMTQLLWSSIDDTNTEDLDQVEYVEQVEGGKFKLMVAIADVDALVKKNDAIDKYAAHNATSVYAEVATFPMLPKELSTNLTSLADHQKRPSVVTELQLGPKGEVLGTDVYLALTFNHAKLAYDSIGGWLEGSSPAPAIVGNTPGLEAQLHLQEQVSELLNELRLQNGALMFDTIEPDITTSNGTATGITLRRKNKARAIIENFMIASNNAVAIFLEQHNSSTLEREVKTPAKWDQIVEVAKKYGVTLPATADARALAQFLSDRLKADPDHFPDLSLTIVKLVGPGEYCVVKPGETHEGHFGLAVHDYAHSTAPNRRFADLVTQRMIKAVLSKQPAPYTDEELGTIATHSTEQDHAAKKVERLLRKVISAQLMASRIGQTFPGIITGVSDKGTFVRVIDPPVEGRIVRNDKGFNVGDKVQVKLLSTDAARGFIDFAPVG